LTDSLSSHTLHIMLSSLHRRLLLPVGLLALLIVIYTTLSPNKHRISDSLRAHSANGVSSETADAQAESVEKSADLVYPLFDYTYDKLAQMALEKKVAKDPCIDVSMPDGGSKAKPGEGLTALVTGGAGFIGSNLIDRLLKLGYRVRIFDNLYTGFLRNVPLDDPNVEFIFGDIMDRKALLDAVNGVHYVYHLAAMSKVVPSLKDSSMARFCTETNALGSWNVLDAVRQQGDVQKVIYAASSTYYGNQPPPHNEKMAPDFLTPYAASKYEGEMQMQIFDAHFNVPTVSTRFFMVYGPRQPSTGAYAIVTGVFARQAADGKPLTIEGDGSHYRDFIHVSDVVEGLILSQQNTDLHGEVVNLGSGSVFSVNDVANLVSKDQVHVDPRPHDLEGTLADTCKMRRLLGYRTKKDFKTEMGHMAKETMKGNVFMQKWLTPAHALALPHLLAPGSPMFSWPKEQNDLDGLLLAMTHVQQKALTTGETESRRVSVVPFSSSSNRNTDTNATDVLINTVFSLVRFGGAKLYMVAATDADALTTCLSLNMPCFDASSTSTPSLISDLISRGLDVHVTHFGNSYISAIDTAISKFSSGIEKADVVGAETVGDVFIKANDKTRAAMALWAQTAPATMARDETFMNVQEWPALDVTKGSFSYKAECTGTSSKGNKQSSSSKETSSSKSSSGDKGTTPEKRDSFDDSSEDSTKKSSTTKATTSATKLSDKEVKTCTSGFYLTTFGCPDSAVDKASGIKAGQIIAALTKAKAWHLSSCIDVEHCDRQQIVPARWIQNPPELGTRGGHELEGVC